MNLFRTAGLTLKLSKCHFFSTSIDYLGFEISEEGVRPGRRKIDAVEKFPQTTDQHKVRQFIGLASFFRRFIRIFSTIARPLTKLLKRDTKWHWDSPVLAFYNPDFETQLHTDASKAGIAGILVQRPSKDAPFSAVAYYSRQTSPEESRFTSYDLETLAVVSSLQRFRVYLLGIPLSRSPVEESCASVLEVRSVDSNWIATLPQNDSELQRIVSILNDPETNYMVDFKNNFVLKRGLLYRKTDDGDRWVVPKGVRWQVVEANHDDIGHFSLDKTLDKIKSNYLFVKMRRFIKKYVESCLECSHAKIPAGKRAGELHPIQKVEYPFHTLHIDHLGPFVRSKKKNSYLLIIVDAFTKYIQLVPVKSTKTVHSIKAMRQYFHTFSVPKRLISDRGTSVTSKRFHTFLDSLGVKHVMNAVATPRANGQVERYNRTVLSALTSTNHGKPDNVWDECISEIQWGLNNTINKGIGKTPSEALFGMRLVGTPDFMLQLNIQDELGETSSTNIETIRNEVSQHITQAQTKQKERFDRSRKKVNFKIGDLVRVEREVPSLGKSRKLVPKLRGPYRISEVLDNDRYVIEDTPVSRKGNRKFTGIFPVDKIHPWLVFKRTFVESDSNESD